MGNLFGIETVNQTVNSRFKDMPHGIPAYVSTNPILSTCVCMFKQELHKDQVKIQALWLCVFGLGVGRNYDPR